MQRLCVQDVWTMTGLPVRLSSKGHTRQRKSHEAFVECVALRSKFVQVRLQVQQLSNPEILEVFESSGSKFQMCASAEVL